ncbi:MAG TPA: ribonuclease G [Gammaproteobacteria bacterium]|nr:ribonuclease G [Gammaproteobacteria bacterium]
MSEEILINVTPRETRVALLDHGVLQEIYIERTRRRGLVGNIYKGTVTRVLPGMQAAFVELGLARTAFLHASDVGHARALTDPDASHPPAPDVRELLHEGQEVLVQVLKDPLGTKGARLTTRISIPSRYLVYMPEGSGVGLSTRIEDEAERERLKQHIESLLPEHSPGGYIARTAAEGAEPEALRADMLFLNKLWESLRAGASAAKPGQLVHEDLPLAVRILRDLSGEPVQRVRVDSADTATRMRQFTASFIPAMGERIALHEGPRPIFEQHGIEEEIQRALERKVALKSGGHLIIDQTEAMTTIDVNTGAYVGKSNLEDTILRTNLEAAQAIARQLKLRNLGGIIIVDFIDMDEESHKQAVLESLELALASDHAKTQVTAVSALGLVEMTRKRTRESLEHVLCEPCPTCQGRGSVKSAETVCYEVFRQVLRTTRQQDVAELRVLAAQEVVDLLLDQEAPALAEVSAQAGKPIRLQVESLYSPEQFDVVPI